MRKLRALCQGMIIFSLMLAGSLGVGAAGKPLSVFVSILPQKYFVERIARSNVKVSVMVRPGADPVTYEPSPRQMAELAHAKAYFRIGVPFEEAWLDRMQKNHPRLLVVDTRKGIPLKALSGHHHHSGLDQPVLPEMVMDPHIWLSPRLAKRQAETICKTLIALDPAHQGDYQRDCAQFLQELDAVDQEIRWILKDAQGGKFMVFHPAWGYFADEYGLEQIPIEVEGKEPSAKELARTIDLARQQGIRLIYVQSQFSTKPAETIAKAIGGQIVQLDPLAEDYLTNLLAMAKAIAAGAR
ncbi:MAG: zinc ABC transporter solute-binding protein [Firmicutes bacterium]|nr:zinc ABC transporter solute-binding protein [Bacillota bacterium]